ncbi:transmembrane reductase CYB561D2 [Megachile rotundata]|uniref:transmembrane reductase CYB561D2 n=1 Tax=Megachile rotundata TaxID=143995 RepID=UPI000258DAF3|nr:PREDICTED: cytochrome b561 domain-containing protein 2-like [Megachile rotundata]
MTDHPGGKGPPSAIMLAFSALTHFLLIAPVIYILVLSFSNVIFVHPILMSLGAGLLMAEAVFTISGDAYISYSLSRMSRIRMHWILHTIGLALLLIGLILIVVHKIDHNKPHFATPHSILGLITIIICFLVAGFGIVTNNSKWLYPRVRPVLLKVMHAFGGILAMILLLATLITGTYSRWWPGSDTGRNLVFASFFIAGFFLLLKPVLGAVSRTKVIMGPPPTTS